MKKLTLNEMKFQILAAITEDLLRVEARLDDTEKRFHKLQKEEASDVRIELARGSMLHWQAVIIGIKRAINIVDESF